MCLKPKFISVTVLTGKHCPVSCQRTRRLRVGWSGVRVPAGVGSFSPYHRVQTGSEGHPASYAMGTIGSFPGCKATAAWSWSQTSI